VESSLAFFIRLLQRCSNVARRVAMALASLATNEIEMLWNGADEVKQEGV
jgi:hypothetical protein